MHAVAQSVRRTIIDRRPLLMSVAVLAWSTKYLVTLAAIHTTGPEVYGVLTAAIAVAAGVGNVVVIRSGIRLSAPVLLVATVALVAVWSLVALAGLGGTIAHIVGPVAGHGPIDPRPRPVPAPLVFTVLGAVGALAIVLAYRMRRLATH